MTREEKLKLNVERNRAVKEAWVREKNLVLEGKGTYDWTLEQQKELLENGRVSGFEGQHMKSVNEYPEYAGHVDNIQLLSHEDHLAAHNCSNLSEKNGYHSPTNGYYDPSTKTMMSFDDRPPQAPRVIDLSKAYCKGKDYSLDMTAEKEMHTKNLISYERSSKELTRDKGA